MAVTPGAKGDPGGAISRRSALLGGGGIVASAALSSFGAVREAGAQATPAAGDYRTTLRLIGTGGGPIPTGGQRVGICSAIVVEDRAYIVDLGQSCLNNIVRSGIKLPWIQAVFVTHLHSDHIAELYNLVWLNLDPTYGITHPIDVWGPGRAGGLPAPSSATPVPTVDPDHPTPGLADYFALSIAATAYDANIRIRDEGWNDVQTMVRVHEIALPEVGASATGDIAPADGPLPGDGERRHQGDGDPGPAHPGLPVVRFSLRHGGRRGRLLRRHDDHPELRHAGYGRAKSWSTR